jgi:LysR family glycine cleavage system transcriptional activator
MRRQLPPFAAVRAFEASARLLSFKRAASELCLTQSAISHQVKTLEEYLGVQLFHREPRGVALTGEGSSYLGSMTDVLDRMSAETARISKRECAGILSARISPGFVRWLIPRLSGFHEAYPDIDLRISSSRASAEFASDDVDASITWGFLPKPGLSTVPLMASSRHPVISPDLLRKGPVLERPEDLKHFTLLHEAGCNNFERWFEVAGVSAGNAQRGLSFSNYDHVLNAAIEGQGVALGYDAIIAGDVRANHLVSLFDVGYPVRILYSFVTPRSWDDHPRIAVFRSWLMRETGTLDAARNLAALASASDVAVHARP